MKTEDIVNFIKINYSILGPSECAKVLNVSTNKVAYLAKKSGLKVDKERLSSRLRKLRKLRKLKEKEPHEYNVNHRLFLNIDNTNKAYLLGLLWGDGSVSCSSISGKINNIVFVTTSPDSEEFLIEFLKTGKWNVYYYKSLKNKNWKTRASFITSNKNISNALHELGYTNKKSGFERILNFIPKKYIHAFLLGLSDSDGTFYINEKRGLYRFSYCSCYDQDWKGIEEIIKSLGLDFKIERTKSNSGSYSKLHIGGKSKSKIWGDFLYQSFNEDKIGLKRKYLKYREISNKCNKWVHKIDIKVERLF